MRTPKNKYFNFKPTKLKTRFLPIAEEIGGGCLPVPNELIDFQEIFKSKGNVHGRQYSRDRLSQIVRENLREHTNLKITPYLFRHLSGSKYFELTGDIHGGAARLGHNVVTHLKTYVHVRTEDKSELLSLDYSEIRKFIRRVG